MKIRLAVIEDVAAILTIHNHAVRELTCAWTDHEDTLSDRQEWFAQRTRDNQPVFVAVDAQDAVLGYAYYGAFRSRSGYRHTAEHTVYVAQEYQGQGVGSALLNFVVKHAETAGYHVLIGGVDGENSASLALHRKCGFEVAARLPETGAKFGRWLDLVFVFRVLDERMRPPA